MSAIGKHEQLRLGFLTAIELPERGFVGGLLVTNHCGRPLEFQCTAPVKPNSTQEILYGPTLAPYVLGELIGGTLLERAEVKPQLILTDRAEMLDLENHIEGLVGLVECGERQESAAPQADSYTLRLGRQIVRFHGAHVATESVAQGSIRQIPAEADLLEPFGRVREALQEALRGGALR